ncbi:MAG: ATP-dependent DNA helicase DinG [Porticoccaceae bacterium]|nr:ATP-dependent DNA helicase DinG [Porticoccaceae bacterium]
MLDTDVRDSIQQSYRQFLKTRELSPRLGQKQMIGAIANALSDDDADKRLAVIEAGTGTGKTVGYLIAALPIARALKKTVVVATGTIALQEQLIHKDLPELLESCGWDYSCALVKGRGRYACNLRMEQIIDSVKSKDAGLFLFEDEQQFNPNAETEELYREMALALEEGTWDGERDSWETRIKEVEWRALTVDRRQCTGRRCRFVNQCPFFNARNDLDESEVIVANHDLVMADLALGGGAILPPPEDCIYIFDEGHRLGDTAVRHFGAECLINSTLSWLERLPKQIKGQTPVFAKDTGLSEQLPRIEKEAGKITELLSMSYPLLKQYVDQSDHAEGRYRFAHGDVGEAIRDLASQITLRTSGWLGRLEVLEDTLSDALSDKQYPVPLPDIELFYQQAGNWLGRAEKLLALWDRLHKELQQNEMPMACWLKLDEAGGGNVDISINASPIQAAEILRQQLWGRCYAAVVTSATLRSLGNFNTLQRETGMPNTANFVSVAGAFDYAAAATLRVPSDAVEGNSVEEHSRYIVDNFESLVENKAGTLLLFSSKRQMEQVYDELSGDMHKLILIQGQYSNREMVRLHKERVDQGRTSILMGLASFAEGVDLPGNYCKHVVIAKLPFAVPDDPLQEALAEWIEDNGGNSFFDISLPIASLRLIQACGRLLRTESDTGTVTILDKRLITKRYGTQLLNALPPFRREIG